MKRGLGEIVQVRAYAEVRRAVELDSVGAVAKVECVYFFFFQAEDGIRDLTVTGVQTCALPISYFNNIPCSSRRVARDVSRLAARVTPRVSLQLLELHDRAHLDRAVLRAGNARQIGRASCRERV